MLKTLIILALLAAPRAAPPTTDAAHAVETTERAFAADAAVMGRRDAFLRHMADDAIVLEPGPVPAKPLYEAQWPDRDVRLRWWPQRVVAARSGDLALSTGPWAMGERRGGYYASIWRKQADGRWKWIYDTGGRADAKAAPGPDQPASIGPVAAEGAGSPAAGFDQARAAEAALASAAATDAATAYRAVVSDDALLLGPRGTETLTADALSARLAVRTGPMTLTLRGGGASRAGDFVWTHGEAGWRDRDGRDRDASPVKAHYMHVWQKRADGWRLIFETLINDT